MSNLLGEFSLILALSGRRRMMICSTRLYVFHASRVYHKTQSIPPQCVWGSIGLMHDSVSVTRNATIVYSRAGRVCQHISSSGHMVTMARSEQLISNSLPMHHLHRYSMQFLYTFLLYLCPVRHCRQLQYPLCRVSQYCLQINRSRSLTLVRRLNALLVGLRVSCLYLPCDLFLVSRILWP